ncbi:MAG: RIP metalloprotease RseP [Bacteroidales bacterium]|nr:RIP metalloprotease RseP [Bacteroidales bacterium]
MVIFIKILQVILALSVLIIIHEFGHYLWARLFKIRVEKFYLFFDVGGKALARWHWGGTEFGIGWLPFGGYCKIAGMIDESMDLEQMKQEPQPWEFRTHPAWQRLLVMAGGVINNFIFAILAYIAIMAIWGQSYIGNEGSRIYVDDLAYEMGFRTGDQILRLDDYVPENFGMLQADLARRDVQKATVLRGTDTLDIYIDQARIGDVLNDPLMFDLAIPFVVDSVMSGGLNADAGLHKGDRIVSLDGHGVEYVQDSRELLARLSSQEVATEVVRGSDTLGLPVRVDSLGRIGVYMQAPNIQTRRYNLLEAIPAGWRTAGETIGGYLSDLRLLARPSTGAYKSVGSFIAIGQVFPETWDWYRFLNILALLSIMLAVMNLLPIPGLDGGHILFTLYEIVSGRKPGEKFLVAAQMVGMILIFGLMFLAFGNDITRLIH